MGEVGQRRVCDYQSPLEIFREYAALSGLLCLDFDIQALATLDDFGHAALSPTRWPVTAPQTGGRFFAKGRFFHADDKARFLPVAHRRPAARTEPRYPFRLNCGQVHDQRHTMTRTGLSPRLSAHLAEPFLGIHPADATHLDRNPAGLAKVTRPTCSATRRWRSSEPVAPRAALRQSARRPRKDPAR